MIGQKTSPIRQLFRPRLATINGQLVDDARPCARPTDCGGVLFAEYQRAKLAWDRARHSDSPGREETRRAAIAAYDAWAKSAGLPVINSPSVWGFN